MSKHSARSISKSENDSATKNIIYLYNYYYTANIYLQKTK